MFCKKLLWAIFMSLAFLMTISPAAAQEYPPDLQKIIDKKQIVIAMVEEDQPPFFMVGNDGVMQGFDVELAQGIAKELGVEVVFNRSAKKFNDTIDVVLRGEADIVISKLSSTLTRAKKVLFSDPYIVLRKGLLVNRLRLAQMKRGQVTEEFIKDLRGEVGVIEGSSYVGFAERTFPNATIKTYKKWDEIIDAVLAGEVLAAFRDELEVKKVIKGRPDVALKLQTVIFKDTQDPIAMAISWENPHLQYWLNQYLRNRTTAMNADKLLDKYSVIFSKSPGSQ